MSATRSGSAAARRRRAARPLVAASIGSYGASLADGSEYRGDYGLGVDALAAWHRPRLRVLETSGAELLAFETIPSLVEAGAIARLLAESDGPPAWVSFQAKDATSLADGAPIEDAVAAVESSPRVVAVGVNCVAPELVTPLLMRCAFGDVEDARRLPESRRHVGRRDEELDRVATGASPSPASFPNGPTAGARLDRRLLPHHPRRHPHHRGVAVGDTPLFLRTRLIVTALWTASASFAERAVRRSDARRWTARSLPWTISSSL